MNNAPLYLKPNVKAEPLFDQWYAWPHLISPAQAARNVTERHLKIMNSYIDAPEEHAKAVRNPRMLGGPFIDYSGERVAEIRALRDRTLNERPRLLELSSALAELDNLLLNEAKGFSLEALYPKVPAPLRGRVELVYDLNNHASFRLLEPLLYRSPYYESSLQSLMLSTIDGDERAFALSTPRLESDEGFHWRSPFASDSVDALFKLTSTPRPFSEIDEFVGTQTEAERDALRSFLTSDEPRSYKRYEGKTARWRYFGHACVLVETPTISLLFDPVVSYSYDSDMSRYTYSDLPDVIDYVLLSHNHQDHVLLETLLQIRHKVKHFIVPRAGGTLHDPSLKLTLENIGFQNVIEISEMEEIRTPDGAIIALPFFGEHADLDIRTKSAYHVRIGKHSLLFAADSCNIEPNLYEHIRNELGDVNVLFLGMECNGAPLSWLYGPLKNKPLDRAMDQSRRFAGSNYDQAAAIVASLRCREVYVYAMGQEPWLNYVMSLKYTEESKPIVHSNRLIQDCRARGLTAERLFGEREMFLA